MDEIQEVITENLRFFRKRRGLSQEELSRLCNYSSTYIGKIERGQRSPSLETLLRIAEALQVPLSSLLDSFDRQRREIKDHPGHETHFYDAAFRRFQFIIGETTPDGTVKRIRQLPWFQSTLEPKKMIRNPIWSCDEFQLSPRLSETIQAFYQQEDEYPPQHFPLSLAGIDLHDDPVDLVFFPHSTADNPERIQFELFLPRIVKKGTPLEFSELIFQHFNTDEVD